MKIVFIGILVTTFSMTGRTQVVDIDDTRSLREALTVSGIRKHQNQLQQIANEHRGTRVAGSEGFRASTEYVHKRMREAGFNVRLQDFPIFQSVDNSVPVLTMISPVRKNFVSQEDFATMSSMGFAEVESEIEAVDLQIPSLSPNHSTSGCDKNDFKDFTRGNIALIQRGTCTFQTKAENALAAGAVGVIIFNEGNPGRTEYLSSRLKQNLANFPVVGASFSVGETLRAAHHHGPTGVRAFIKIDVLVHEHIVQNIIAETRAGDDSRVLIIGAHLDSVAFGPGINDNGSGSSANLEIAEKIATLEIPLKNKLRFIWFSAEEFGLLGSEYYVASLTDQERQNILGMLNFDMINSFNYARFVYDGDNSEKSTLNAKSGPEGSGYVEKIFLDYFSAIGLTTHPTAFDGRSDYGPFIERGIPAGGVFAGAEGLKSPALAEIYGGIPYAPFDPCYHRACDDFLHTGGSDSYALALKSLDELSDAAAHAILRLAMLEHHIRPPAERAPMEFDFEYRGGLLVK